MLTIKVKVQKSDVKRELRQIRGRITLALNNARDKALVAVALTQVESYGTDSRPAKPQGSTYTRTGKLRRGGRKKVTSTRLPDISGEFYTEGVPYDKYVVGKLSEQAAIHKGRWLSLEEQEETGQRVSENIVKKEISKL